MRILHAPMAILAALLLVSCSSIPRASKDQLRHHPEVYTGRLENGLTYSLMNNPEPQKRLALRLVVSAGSALEDDDQQGLAHVVEHMAFNGTKSFRKQALVDFLEKMGVNFGAHLNAYTSFDETVYMLEVPTDSDNTNLVETAFQILSEWAGAVEFEAEEIDKERGVVIEEWRLRRGASQRLRDEQLPVLLKNSRYADRLPIGKKDILETFDHDRLRQYYKDWYRPNLMHVIAVGPMDKRQIESYIQKHFGQLKSNGRNPDHGIFDVPVIPGTLYSSATDPEATESEFSVSYKLDPDSMRTTDDFRRSIVTSLATSMLNQRLREIAHNPDAPFLSAYAYHSDFNPTRSFFGAGGKTKNGHIEDGLDAVMTELRRAAENGFTDRELTAEKRRLESTVESMYKERDQFKSSSYARQLISSFLDHKPLISVEDRYDMTMEFLPEITVDEVNEMFAGWIVEDGRVIQVSSPEKTGLIVPGEEDLAALVAKVEAKEIEPYKDAVLEAPLFPVMPSPGAIAEKKKLPKVDTEQWTLSNGIKVIVRQTDFSKDEVIFQAFSPGGNSLVSDSDHLSAVTATAIAGESGLGPLDKIQLEKKLAGIQADVAPFISEIYEGLNGWSSVEDLEMLFKLINLTFTQPRFDEDANKTFLTRLKTQVNNRQYRPEAAFIDMMQRELSKNHPRRRPWEVSMLDELNFERSVNIYKERFADASDFTFVFVGNFKKRDLEKLCTLYLASLPTLNRNESWKDVGVGLPASGLMRTFYKGKEDKSMVKVVYSEQFDWNRKNRMLVNVTCRILSIRLREVLREEMSGTYGVAVRPDFQHYPRQQLQVDIDFGCSPSRAKTMLESALKEVNIMRLDMIKQEYLDKVKALLLNSHEVNLRENSFWLSNLAFCYQNDESPADILKFEELLEEITPEEVQACARKIFSDERMSIFMLYPEDFKKP